MQTSERGHLQDDKEQQKQEEELVRVKEKGQKINRIQHALLIENL